MRELHEAMFRHDGKKLLSVIKINAG